jgi:hypothetical protein
VGGAALHPREHRAIGRGENRDRGRHRGGHIGLDREGHADGGRRTVVIGGGENQRVIARGAQAERRRAGGRQRGADPTEAERNRVSIQQGAGGGDVAIGAVGREADRHSHRAATAGQIEGRIDRGRGDRDRRRRSGDDHAEVGAGLAGAILIRRFNPDRMVAGSGQRKGRLAAGRQGAQTRRGHGERHAIKVGLQCADRLAIGANRGRKRHRHSSGRVGRRIISIYTAVGGRQQRDGRRGRVGRLRGTDPRIDGGTSIAVCDGQCIRPAERQNLIGIVTGKITQRHHHGNGHRHLLVGTTEGQRGRTQGNEPQRHRVGHGRGLGKHAHVQGNGHCGSQVARRRDGEHVALIERLVALHHFFSRVESDRSRHATGGRCRTCNQT